MIPKLSYCTARNNLVKLAIQVTQFLDLLFESTLILVLSTETKTELNVTLRAKCNTKYKKLVTFFLSVCIKQMFYTNAKIVPRFFYIEDTTYYVHIHYLIQDFFRLLVSRWRGGQELPQGNKIYGTDGMS